VVDVVAMIIPQDAGSDWHCAIPIAVDPSVFESPVEILQELGLAWHWDI